MNGIRHPFTGALYEPEGGGAVRVSLDGRTGLFSREGRWMCGELREADPHLCGWVGGRRIASHRMPAANGEGQGNGAGPDERA
jgi:hypothetical protein